MRTARIGAQSPRSAAAARVGGRGFFISKDGLNSDANHQRIDRANAKFGL